MLNQDNSADEMGRLTIRHEYSQRTLNDFRPRGLDPFFVKYWVSLLKVISLKTIPLNNKPPKINFRNTSSNQKSKDNKLKVNPNRVVKFFLVNRVENQKLNQTAVLLSFG